MLLGWGGVMVRSPPRHLTETRRSTRAARLCGCIGGWGMMRVPAMLMLMTVYVSVRLEKKKG